jgi:hypothetical protein
MRWASCRPFIEPGIWTSVKTAETSIRFSSIEIASIAFSASMTAHPAAWTASAVAHRSRTSSSTTSTRGRLHAWCCIITGFLGISQDALEDLRRREVRFTHFLCRISDKGGAARRIRIPLFVPDDTYFGRFAHFFPKGDAEVALGDDTRRFVGHIALPTPSCGLFAL